MTATSLKISPRTDKAIDGLQDKAAELAHDMRSSKDQLIHDFKALAQEAERLLAESNDMGGTALDDAQRKLRAQLNEARHRLAELEALTREKAREAARATDDYVHENPWQSMAIAGGVGVVVGLLLGSRRAH